MVHSMEHELGLPTSTMTNFSCAVALTLIASVAHRETMKEFRLHRDARKVVNT